MTREEREVFICNYCGKEYPNEHQMNKCVLEHDIIYIALSRDKLRLLVYSLEAANLAGVKVDEDTYRRLQKFKKFKRRG